MRKIICSLLILFTFSSYSFGNDEETIKWLEKLEQNIDKLIEEKKISIEILNKEKEEIQVYIKAYKKQ